MKKYLKKIVIVLLICVLVGSIYSIYKKKQGYEESDKFYAELQQKKNELASPSEGDSAEGNSSEAEKPKRTIDLSDINKDYVCWIEIEKTNIDYPIVQAKDKSYYLHRDLHGNYLYSGTIFIDPSADYEKSENLVIFGHNMKNGTIFSDLEKFKDKDFFYSNPKITLIDKEDAHEYEVFAVLLVDKDFPYIKCNFEDKEAYKTHLKRIVENAKFTSDNLPTTDDKIITLSTCSYEFKDARTVVLAKKL